MYTDIEIWKTIEDHPNYEISNYGNLRSKRTLVNKKISIMRRHNRPEYRINILQNGNRINSRLNIARCVFKHFKGKLIKGKIIDHEDNDPFNNHHSNLQQITQRENIIKNVRKDKTKLTSNLPGVHTSTKRKIEGKRKQYRAVAYMNGKNNYLGYYKTPEEANQVYNEYINKHGNKQ